MTSPILATALSNSTALLRSYTVDPQLGKVIELVRTWEHIDSRYAESLVDSMSTTGPVINPVASSSVYSGTWYRANDIGAEQMPMQDHIIIVETLVPDTLGSKTYSHAVNCRESRTVELFYDLTAGQIDTVLADYASSSRGHYYNVNVSRNNNGTWDVIVVDRVGQAYTDAEFTSADSTDSIDRTQRKYNQSNTTLSRSPSQGVTVTADMTLNEFCLWDKTERGTTSKEHGVATHINRAASGVIETRTVDLNERSVPVDATSSQGIVNTQEVAKQQDGTYDIVQNSQTSVPLDADGNRIAAGFTEAVSTTENSRSEITASDGGIGVVTSAQNAPNVDGTYNSQLTSRTSLQLDVTANAAATGFTTSTTRQRNARAVLTAASQQGVTQESDANKNDDGTIDTNLRSRTSVPLTADGNTDADGYTESVSATDNSRTEIVATDGGTGVINSAQNNANDDGTWNARLTSRTSIPLESDGNAIAEGYTEAVSTTENSRSEVVATDGGTGIINTAQNNPNDDGTFNAQLRSRTSLPQAVAGNESAIGYERSSTRLRNQTATPAAPAASIGIINENDWSKNEDGTSDGTIRSTTTISQTTTSGETAVGYSEDGTIVDHGTVALDDSGSSVGVTVRANNRNNPDGTFNSERTVRSVTTQDVSSGEVAIGYDESTTRFRDQQSAPVLAGPSTGIINTTDTSKNTDGTVDGVVRSRTAKAQFANGGENAIGYAEESQRFRDKSTSTPVSTASIGIVYSTEASRNIDGTESGVVRSRTANALFANGNENAEGYVSSATNLRNQHAQSAAPASSVGVINEANWRRGDDGTYDGTLNSRTSIEQQADGEETAIGEYTSTTRLDNTQQTLVATSSIGVTEVVDARKNADGTDNVVKRSSTRNELEAQGTEYADAYTSSRTNVNGAQAQLTAPAASTGVITSADSQRERDGTYRGAITSRTSISQTTTAQTLAEGQIRSTTKLRNETAASSPAASSIGIINVADNSKNADGTVDTELTSTTSVNLNESWLAGGYFLEDGVSVNRAASVIPVVAPGGIGISNSLRTSINVDGTVDTTLVSSTAQSHTSTAFPYYTPSSTRITELFRGSSTVPAYSGTNYGGITASYSSDGTLTGTIQKVTLDDNTYPVGQSSTASKTVYFLMHHSGETKRRGVVILQTKRVHSNISDAMSAIDGTDGIPGYKPRVTHMNGKVISTRYDVVSWGNEVDI